MKTSNNLSDDAIKTLEYYDNNASSFVKETQTLNFNSLQKKFLTYIPLNSKILDFGCGAGRDSKFFINLKYDVSAIDGSIEMCKATEKLIGKKVLCSTFQDFIPSENYDGIWACASLLHLNYNELISVLKNLSNCLNKNGCLYSSFKYGEFSGIYNERFYTFMTEQSFNKILHELPDLELIEYQKTNDIRENKKNEAWLNIFLRKK